MTEIEVGVGSVMDIQGERGGKDVRWCLVWLTLSFSDLDLLVNDI